MKFKSLIETKVSYDNYLLILIPFFLTYIESMIIERSQMAYKKIKNTYKQNKGLSKLLDIEKFKIKKRLLYVRSSRRHF